MRKALCLMLLGALASTSAYASPQLNCSQFQHNDDDSWSAKVPMTIAAPQGSFQLIPGLEFRDGHKLMGYDLGYALERKCGR